MICPAKTMTLLWKSILEKEGYSSNVALVLARSGESDQGRFYHRHTEAGLDRLSKEIGRLNAAGNPGDAIQVKSTVHNNAIGIGHHGEPMSKAYYIKFLCLGGSRNPTILF